MVRATLALLLLVAAPMFAHAQVGDGDRAQTPRERRATRLVVRADARAASGDAGGALGVYRDAVSADPSFAPAYLGLARAYLVQGRTDDALETIRVGVARAPRSVELVLMQAEVLESQERLDVALEELRALCAWAPDDPRPWLARARVAQKAGAWTEALHAHRRIVASNLDPERLVESQAMVRALERIARLDPLRGCAGSPVRAALCR